MKIAFEWKRTWVLVASLVTQIACASDAPFQFPAGSVGEKVQTRLRELAQLCFSKPVFSPQFIPEGLTVGDIRSSMEVPVQQTHFVSGVSIERLVREVLPSTGDYYTLLNNGDARPELTWTYGDTAPAADLNMAVLRISCGSMLKAAMQNKVSLGDLFGTLGAADIKSALDVDASTSKTNSLAVMYGEFQSPLYLALHDQDGDEKYVTSHLAVWKYYQTQPSAVDTARYLARFHGLSIATGNATDFQSELKASVDAGYKLWVASGSATGNSNLSFRSSFLSRTFQLYLNSVPGSPDVEVRSMPTVKEIESVLRKFSTYFPPYPSLYYTPGVSIPFRVQVRHLPDEYCSDPGSTWKVSTNPSAGVRISDFAGKSSAGSCELSVNAVLPAGLTGVDLTLDSSNKAVRGKVVSLTHHYDLQEIASTALIQDGSVYVGRVAGMGAATFDVRVPYHINVRGVVKSTTPRTAEVVTMCGADKATLVSVPTLSTIPLSNVTAIAFMVRTPPNARTCKVTVPIDWSYEQDDHATGTANSELKDVPFELPGG